LAFSAGNQDACVVTLDEFIGRCENCTVEVIMTLVNTLTRCSMIVREIGGRRWRPG
jgi:hypothetical protein